MFDVQTKVKRQIEILGLCVENTQPFTAADLAELFGCEELTIKRDMHELRAHGIDIHSSKRKGVGLSSTLDTSRLKELISQYIGLSNAADTFDKATALLIKRQKQKALSHIVLLQRCIDSRTVARIDYEKEAGDIERDRELHPLQIFQSDGTWRILAMNDGKMKQYLVTKILSVRPLSRHFKRVPQEEIDGMFRYSFRSWLGPAKYNVRIRLSPSWAAKIKPRQMTESEVLTEQEDGSVILEATVNSLEEVAGWVVSRGAGVAVLEPEELRLKVLTLAKGALSNY